MTSETSETFARMGVPATGAPLRLETVVHTTPPRGWVRVAVHASGVCFADVGTASAAGRETVFPVTPGHEIAGVVAALGEDVTGWRIGDRVAVGWFGGSCGHCTACRMGDVVHCPERKTPGVSYPGGWAQSITAPSTALAAIPDGMDFFDAAPMGCAGVTTFNAIRHARLRPGATVAVFGVGGLGHLAIQFAARLGHRTVAIARGDERADLAYYLGAHHYLDSSQMEAGHALAELGGADLILNTASTTEPVAGLLTGLAVGGRLTMIGVDDGQFAVPVGRLVMKGQTITGQLTGSAQDTEEAMRFAHLNQIRPMIERMPLAQANQAVERVATGQARFRIVLDPRSAR
ncbi:MAG: alcohol dehydrogenase catalytic domain-containing protein [Propionicimonas sp.]